MKTRALPKKLEEAFSGVVLHGSPKKQIKALMQVASAAGLQGYVGYVLHAGTVADGSFQVQFNVGNQGFSSRWPEWAYLTARESLLHERKLWVIADGDPYGPNLLQSLILQIDI